MFDGFIGLSLKHERDNTITTNVMQAQCVITNVNTFRERLIYARELRDLTQQDLANKSGVKQSAIGNYESGLRKSAREVVALATALGVRPEWLQHGKGLMSAQDMGVPGGPIASHGAPAWPFTSITPEQFSELSEREKGRIEGYIEAVMQSSRSARSIKSGGKSSA